ncbi:FAD/NAD(P)-binding oxidoreductase [Actinomadura viridis]|uniref:NADPH-dependent 2,4-dienoyl-CoA reductase/sulfur reductase-like enzyme n=1 Tax=Actinomadura viridis TaxID=58110 RepID=A0A931DF95_9ACTN|nr:FAD-dependent oxidoreductase [Actinomadura viridis]MBG6087729.1 NADPH-dependent 2,4-dienoyl-CoA reductase/sulfur reductase-like enzyme [Actinomadura viridis]
MTGHIVVVGGGLAGLRAAEQLRATGWVGAVTVVGAEEHLPYNRPPLSKEVLAGKAGAGGVAAAHAATALRRRKSIEDVNWRLGTPVVDVSLNARRLTLADGGRLAFDGLVVASGLRPRRPAIPGPEFGRYALRTVDDAVALRQRLVPGAQVMIVGGGFVGCEVAATARRAGCEVTVVEPCAEPMERALGPELGRVMRRHHQAQGVRFITGRIVAELLSDGPCERVTAAVLDDGTTVRADLVVESIGSQPNVEWLERNGLDLSDGVVCDNRMRVEGRPGVVAAGDVARFPNPRYDDEPRRVEHWCVPGDTARRAAATLAADLGVRPPDDSVFAPLPSFWSDQYDVRVQSYGAPGLGDRCELLDGGLDHPRALKDGVAMAYYRDHQMVGVVLIGIPLAEHRRYHELVTAAPAPV